MLVSAEFLVTSLIVVVSPGTGALYTISTGLSGGNRLSAFAALGCTLGIVPHMLAAITGLATLFHTSPLAFTLMKYIGAAWLIYMAWSTLRQRGALAVSGESDIRPPLNIITHAILINLLNPKLPLFFLAFLPQFIAADATNPVTDMLLLSAIFMLMTLVVFLFYGACAAFMRGYVLSREGVLKALRACFAIGFIGLGVKLALTQR